MQIAKGNKEKAEERVLKYQQNIIEARTEKQEETAKINLAKARQQFELAVQKFEKAQKQYDYLIRH